MNEITSATYRISIKGFVHEGGRILLVQEGTNQWGLPGGGLDHGETVREGLNREMQEEVGVGVSWMSDLPVTVGPGYIPEDRRWKFWLTYEVKLAGKPTPGHKGMKLGWFLPEEIAKLEIDEVEADNLATVLQLM